MRCIRGGRAAVFTSILITSLVVADAAATAGPDPGDGTEGADIAVPAQDAAAQLAAAGVTPAPAEVGAQATAPFTAARLDDFRYDRQITTGFARDVCFGRLRRGTALTFAELTRRFGGSAGTLYACRERWNAAEEPDCNGTLVSPSVNPLFRSTCWSNHAQGRALDVMVGFSGGGYNTARGNAIVNWLLAPDANGNYSANARRLGVQQILWRDHCWNTDDDRGIVSVGRMRECGIGHFDHIHIDLTLRGARGRTSYWGGQPQIWPKTTGLLWWDNDTGRRSMQSWFNYRPVAGRTARWLKRWDMVVAGDFDSDRASDDLLRWDRDTGHWVVWTRPGGRWRETGRGRWTIRWDRIVSGDWDGDFRRDDLLLWDVHTGDWLASSWSSSRPRNRGSGRWPAGFDAIGVGDFDEDNRLDEVFLRDQHSGRMRIVSWNRFVPSVKRDLTWPRTFDRFVVGDWDSDGEINDMLMLQSSTGSWRMMSWNGFRPTGRGSGQWLARFKQFVAADLDGEGRLDDMVRRAPGGGRWNVVEWHYYRARRHGPPRFARGWDQIISGQWG
jgi:hypothetical protein